MTVSTKVLVGVTRHVVELSTISRPCAGYENKLTVSPLRLLLPTRLFAADLRLVMETWRQIESINDRTSTPKSVLSRKLLHGRPAHAPCRARSCALLHACD